MSHAEYLAAFGVPMSEEEKQKSLARNREIERRWVEDIAPNLIREPNFFRKLLLLFSVPKEYAVPEWSGLPRAPLTSMSGYPLHLFHKKGDIYYYAGPMPSPGFPGS